MSKSFLKRFAPRLTDIAEKDVGWQYSGEGAWRYVPTRRMSDTIQHPANQGTVNGQPDICEPNRQEEDHISRKLNEMQDVILLPIKDDICEWITRSIGIKISSDSFLSVLDSGIVLCKLSNLIEEKAKECERQGKLTESSDVWFRIIVMDLFIMCLEFIVKQPLPSFKLKCNDKAKSGTWFARDNVTNFLGWGRAYGMTDETMFDSEDLVAHKHEKPVINCLMELARIGWRFGLDPPNIIRMEREIDKEEKQVFQPPPFIPTPVEIIPKKPEEKPVERPPSAKSEKVDLHTEVKRIALSCKCQDYVNKLSEGVYDVFGKRVFIRLLRGKHLMVRVGGGWDTFENYLNHHDPIQVYEFRRSQSRDSLKDKFDGYLVIRSKYKS